MKVCFDVRDCEMRWRWDQGRLAYFNYESIVRIATTLCSLNGVSLDSNEDPLRVPLMSATELPFAPDHYTVWRNYARVFRCSLLATSIGNKLVCTDICRLLAQGVGSLTSDEYLNLVFSRFALPFPTFADYDSTTRPVYPFLAIIKFAMARYEIGCSLDELFSYVIGNDCDGTEPLGFYQSLAPTHRDPIGDEERQVREMLSFMGQASYLRWLDGRLYIDTSDFPAVTKAVSPLIRVKRSFDSDEEFLSITKISDRILPPSLDIQLGDRPVGQFAFQEGGRIFGAHGKIERSPMLRSRYFRLHPDVVCDACGMDTNARYPWTHDRTILELHHILPLCATILVNGTTTLLDDIVPLCPNCHKSIHSFYRFKLKEWDMSDFSSKTMARDVYRLAKASIVK